MLVRLVLLVLMVFLGYSVLNALWRWLGRHSTPASGGKDPDRMVACCQCGTYIPQLQALHKKIAGQHCYFCDNNCWQEFKKK